LTDKVTQPTSNILDCYCSLCRHIKEPRVLLHDDLDLTVSWATKSEHNPITILKGTGKNMSTIEENEVQTW